MKSSKLLASILLLALACQKQPNRVVADEVVVPPPPANAVPEPEPSADAGSPRADPDLRITLERTRCYGACPEYRVTVSGDGVVEFEGLAFVREKGRVQDRVDRAAFEQLLARFRAANFDALAPPWQCPPVHAMSTDMPSAKLTLEHDGLSHTVDHYLGDGCAPKILNELEDAVDAAVGSERWTRCPDDEWCPE